MISLPQSSDSSKFFTLLLLGLCSLIPACVEFVSPEEQRAADAMVEKAGYTPELAQEMDRMGYSESMIVSLIRSGADLRATVAKAKSPNGNSEEAHAKLRRAGVPEEIIKSCRLGGVTYEQLFKHHLRGRSEEQFWRDHYDYQETMDYTRSRLSKQGQIQSNQNMNRVITGDPAAGPYKTF